MKWDVTWNMATEDLNQRDVYHFWIKSQFDLDALAKA
jgi:hypothetical protein